MKSSRWSKCVAFTWRSRCWKSVHHEVTLSHGGQLHSLIDHHQPFNKTILLHSIAMRTYSRLAADMRHVTCLPPSLGGRFFFSPSSLSLCVYVCVWKKQWMETVCINSSHGDRHSSRYYSVRKERRCSFRLNCDYYLWAHISPPTHTCVVIFQLSLVKFHRK